MTPRDPPREELLFEGPDTILMKFFDLSADSVHGDLTGKFS